jgi:hypothetical protein
MKAKDRILRAVLAVHYVVVPWLIKARRLRAWQRGYYVALPWLLGGAILFELILAALFLVVFFAATQHLRIEARTDSVEIEFSPGQPIAWALGGARLLDCSQLAQVASPARMRNIKEPLADEAEISLAAIEEVDSKRLSTVRARVSVHGNDLVVELERLVKQDGLATASVPGCSKDASRVAVLDRGDGIRRGISLPAQLRLEGERIGNGLTLEFRGDLRIGNDVSSSSQPLLTSGRLALREVRSPWPWPWSWLQQTFGIAQFEIESRDLGLGDKVTIAAPSPNEVSEDAPRGFVRIVKGVRSAEMSVYATTVVTQVEIVRPFNPPEPPKAHWLKRLWADELLSQLAAVIVAVGALVKWLFTHALSAPNENAQDS